ncbi:MAG: wyosine biosynthesis protein TYW1, partial [Euryarchaeota archaeon RBG_16_67_27]
FYGIESHRCLQMTPTVDACNLGCMFCWRTQEWGSNSLTEANDPGLIVEESIRAQRELLSGYKGNSDVPRERFLVTNGTTPTVLRRMAAEGRLPTQLYVTVAAPNEPIYRTLMAPRSDHEWEKLRETLALLPSLDTRTVVRHTLVDGWNLGWEEEYAALDAIGKPMFVECKGYSFVGESRLRLKAENMPSHASIRAFAERLAGSLGYRIAGEREDSRVVLLTPDGALRPIPTGGH